MKKKQSFIDKMFSNARLKLREPKLVEIPQGGCALVFERADEYRKLIDSELDINVLKILAKTTFVKN